MVCARHRLAAGPDGRCVLCRRAERAVVHASTRQLDRRIHRRLRLFIACVACVAAYATLMALVDTSPRPGGRAPPSGPTAAP